MIKNDLIVFLNNAKVQVSEAAENRLPTFINFLLYVVLGEIKQHSNILKMQNKIITERLSLNPKIRKPTNNLKIYLSF